MQYAFAVHPTLRFVTIARQAVNLAEETPPQEPANDFSKITDRDLYVGYNTDLVVGSKQRYKFADLW